MILCYACNEWKPGEVAPFAICEDCKRPEKRRERELRQAGRMISLYWQLKPIEQDGIRAVVNDEVSK